MSDKVRTTLYLDKQIVKKAKEMGLNISKTCENCLKQTIVRIETPNMQNINQKGGTGTVGSVNMVGSRGFEPRISKSRTFRC